MLPDKPAHLNDIFHADTGETRQFWSLPYLPGSRYTDRPVFVLTSDKTFSGGEDLCYPLQARGRAELIGGALRHVLELSDVPPRVADEARDALARFIQSDPPDRPVRGR